MAGQCDVRKIRAEVRGPEKNHSRLKETSTTGQCGEGEYLRRHSRHVAFVAQRSAVTLTTSNWSAEKRMWTKKKWRQQEPPGSSSMGSAGSKSQEGEMKKSRKDPEAFFCGLL